MITTLAIGTRKGLWFARRDGESDWTLGDPHFLNEEIPSLAWDDLAGEAPAVLVAVRSEHWGPTVVRSPDLGQTWDEPQEGAIRFPEDTRVALERVWQLQPDAHRPGVVWAGCEPTSLWRSDDGGRHFELVRGLWDHPHRPQWFPGAGGAAVHTVVTRADDDAWLLAAMSTGGVYRSSDGGQSWSPSNSGISAYFLPDPDPEFGQCVHKVCVDADGPDRLYAQNHHGVYRSDDAGQSWISIADGLPSDFGFVFLAHPRRPGTAWVVPLTADSKRVPPQGQLRAHRTRDAGFSWQESGAGLPDGCWSAVLRDAACVSAVSDRPQDPAQLALGTRDGCVYVSDDDGETFAEVARHLPDVLCVRAHVEP